MTVEKNPLPTELIDALLTNYKKPEDLIGQDGILKQLTKALGVRAAEGFRIFNSAANPEPRRIF